MGDIAKRACSRVIWADNFFSTFATARGASRREFYLAENRLIMALDYVQARLDAAIATHRAVRLHFKAGLKKEWTTDYLSTNAKFLCETCYWATWASS